MTVATSCFSKDQHICAALCQNKRAEKSLECVYWWKGLWSTSGCNVCGLWSRDVCVPQSAYCLFECVRVCAQAGLTCPMPPCMFLAVSFWVFCFCGVCAHSLCVYVCEMWFYRAGVRTEPRWRRGSRARPAGGATDSMVMECLRVVHTYAHTHSHRHSDNALEAGWHYSSHWVEEPQSPPQLPGRTTTVTLHWISHEGG